MERSWCGSCGTLVSLALLATRDVFFRVASHFGPVESLLNSVKCSCEAHVAAGCVVVCDAEDMRTQSAGNDEKQTCPLAGVICFVQDVVTNHKATRTGVLIRGGEQRIQSTVVMLGRPESCQIGKLTVNSPDVLIKVVSVALSRRKRHPGEAISISMSPAALVANDKIVFL